MSVVRRLLMGAAGGGAGLDLYRSVGNLVFDGASFTIDSGASYKAFPGLTLMANGNLLLVYRKGTSHVGDNGVIAGRISSDSGVTWGSEATIYNPADDPRDPNVTTLADGRVALSTFRYDTGSSVAYQVEVLFSSDNGVTWGSPVVVPTIYTVSGHDYDQAACSAPIVEMTDGTLLVPVYMADIGFNFNSFVAKSTDAGATWTVPILVATGGSKKWTEPWIVRRPSDEKLLCLIRVDNLNQTWSSYSTDGGSTWSAAAVTMGSASLDSRASTLYTRHGALLTGIRATGGQGQYETSWDFGATWAALTNLPSPSSSYDYAGVAQLDNGRILLVWAYTNTSSDADLYGQWFLDTGP